MTSTAVPAPHASSPAGAPPARGLRTATVLIVLGLLTGAGQLASTPSAVGGQVVVVPSPAARLR